jgi:hypothetical protein
MIYHRVIAISTRTRQNDILSFAYLCAVKSAPEPV